MARRLPGIAFEVRSPDVAQVLPRMDIAAFVGFASSGPLHVPVPIEDAAQFASIFGADAMLAWDSERAEWARAQLGPAVRAFFRNGGRRCWVIRVADDATAQPDTVAPPGILQAIEAPDGSLTPRQATAWARSVGSWADSVWLSTGLTVDARTVQAIELVGARGEVHLRVAGLLAPGDLLRLRFLDSGQIAFVGVESIILGSSERGAGPVRFDSSVLERQPPTYRGRAVWFAEHGVPTTESSPPGPTWTATWWVGPREHSASALRLEAPDTQTLSVILPTGLAEAPTSGSTIHLAPEPESTMSESVWLTAVDVDPGADIADSHTVLVRGPALRWLPPPASLPPSLPVCERLLLSLRASAVDTTHAASPGLAVLRLDNLGFVPGAAHSWTALPSDADLFAPDSTPEQRERRETHASLWREAASPRFPIAGRDPRIAPETPLLGAAVFTFPLAVTGLPDVVSWMAPPDGLALDRDGLARFSSDLFLDEALAGTLTAEVLNRADGIRYFAPLTRALRGVHAALALDEVTLVAAPDAVHRPWQPVPRTLPSAAGDVEPLARPEWWHFLDCAPEIKRTREPEWGNFLDCAIRVITPPVIAEPLVDTAGTIRLEWTTPGLDAESAAQATYVLEEASQPDFADAYVLSEGEATERTVYGRSPGDHYYHVRVIVGPNTSDWSSGVVARVAPEGGWAIPPLANDETPAFDLLTVQRDVLRMCAARGDMFAVLSLPEHYREDDAIAHVDLLPPSDAPVFRTTAPRFELPFGFGERSALSYGAVFHPWLIQAEESGDLTRVAPDGAQCGVMARRALARGAWIAPANERLDSPVALTPHIDPRRWLDLQTAQINVVRQEPYGFVSLSADTLSSDPDLLQINVRRLLQLLRRLALRLGTGFVFEPHDDAFRRRVRRDVESVLGGLFERGAFAGETPEQSYQVVFRSTPEDVDAGRFIVDLRVAPALPLTFLTVRLVQVAGRTAVTEVR